MAEQCLDYRRPDPFDVAQRAMAGRLGFISIAIFVGQFAVAVLLVMFVARIPSSFDMPLKGLFFSASVLGTVWGYRALGLSRRSVKAWFGFLLNLLIGFGGLGWFMFMQYVFAHMET
jgi:hypothetical protein